ncbi:MAG: hypothetical protein IPN26_17690 [Bacteroidetes bacterium]|nr:hypothetical protein [Bacteroidota bacterium]
MCPKVGTLCPTHIPLQSGSNTMLASMRRRYRRELYAEKVESIKSKMPHACIGADVIVGYPGESEELFEETLAFLTALDISYLHVFTPRTRQYPRRRWMRSYPLSI